MSATEKIGSVVLSSTGINVGSGRVTNLALCTSNLDGANKNYVDSQALTGTNIGTGTSVFAQKTGTTLQFKGFIGDNQTVSSDSTFAYMNNNMFYAPYPQNVADLTSITGLVGASKYNGAVLASNGKIYCPPSSTTNVLIIDPKTNTIDTTTITGITAAVPSKWNGGVLATNGKIYCIPNTFSAVLIIDTTTNTIDTTTLAGLPGGWSKGTLANNGKIYCVPASATNVLIIDPIGNTIDTTTLATIANPTATNKWRDASLAPNGKIYCIPQSESRILIINPINNTLDTTSMPATFASGVIGGKWACSTLAQNGKIYCPPCSTTCTLIINPVDPAIDSTTLIDTTTLTGILPGTNSSFKFYSCVLAPNGKIYCPPNTYSTVLIIDPIANTVDNTTIPGFVAGSDKWDVSCLAPNGKVYCIPFNETRLMIIPTGIPTISVDFCLSADKNNS